MADKVLGILKAIFQSTTPGKKMVQKLIYLIERKGIDLGLDYRIHFYGPYSSDLDQYLHLYESEGLLKIDTSGTTHKINMISNNKDTSLTHIEETIINDIISKFISKSPQDLEILTTTDFVACDLIEKDRLSTEGIIASVKKIKGSKFTVQEILLCIKSLRENGFIN